MAPHRVLVSHPDPFRPGPFRVLGPEAHHAARVKRLTTGDPLELLNAHGSRAAATLRQVVKAAKGEWELQIDIEHAWAEPPIHPALHVRSGAPQGQRLEWMIDQLSQVGAASWGPLVSARSAAEPRAHKLDRLERIALEACKQCGRAHAMAISRQLTLTDALRTAANAIVLAHPDAEPLAPALRPEITLLIGPEGGFTNEEVERARAAGASLARTGPHVMRVETAAVAASAAILRDAIQPSPPVH